jgi:hypothetical protein
VALGHTDIVGIHDSGMRVLHVASHIVDILLLRLH